MNPVTSIMSKYYEKTKGYYSKDIDHLATFNKNGLWIKENLKNGERVISASYDKKNKLKDLVLFNFDENYILKEKIYSKTADVANNNWTLHDVNILKIEDTNKIQQKIEKIIPNENFKIVK